MLGKNLQFLRKHKGLSQQELADQFSIPRSTLGDYERGKTEPSIDSIIRFSRFFNCNIDNLLKHKLYNEELHLSLGESVKVLAITVDNENHGNIELVDTKAEAGYMESFQDPEYIRDLPKIQFPNLTNGTYRGFEIQGDSMLPMESGSIVITRYIESTEEVKDNKTYIVVSRSEGLVYKRVRNDKANNRLVLISDNPMFLPYSIEYADIDEVWQYQAHLSFNDELSQYTSSLESKIDELHNKIDKLNSKLD